MRKRDKLAVKYPKNISTIRSKLFYWLSAHEYRFNMGIHTVGKISRLFPDVGWALAGYMYITSDRPTVAEIGVVLIIGAVIMYILGYIWLYLDLDKIQAQVPAERDPLKKATYDAVTNKGEKGEKL